MSEKLTRRKALQILNSVGLSGNSQTYEVANVILKLTCKITELNKEIKDTRNKRVENGEQE